MTGPHDEGSARPAPREPLMTVTSALVGRTVVLEVSGELDLHTAPDLVAAVDDALARWVVTRVVIGLSRVDFVGSAGLGVLASLATRTTSAGSAITMRLVAPAGHRPVVRPWAAMNLQHILPLHPDVETALAVED